MSNFSKNLKFLREQKNLSQNKLAAMLNVNQTTVARWENGEISPSIDNVLDVADVLNVSVSDLTGRCLSNDVNFDELEILFSKNKDILTNDDKDYIKFIIEKRKKEIDDQVNN